MGNLPPSFNWTSAFKNFARTISWHLLPGLERRNFIVFREKPQPGVYNCDRFAALVLYSWHRSVSFVLFKRFSSLGRQWCYDKKPSVEIFETLRNTYMPYSGRIVKNRPAITARFVLPESNYLSLLALSMSASMTDQCVIYRARFERSFER